MNKLKYLYIILKLIIKKVLAYDKSWYKPSFKMVVRKNALKNNIIESEK